MDRQNVGQAFEPRLLRVDGRPAESRRMLLNFLVERGKDSLVKVVGCDGDVAVELGDGLG